jgi:glycosyltransferase involved in cell wall biosynthesis
VISILILTLNEEINISECLDSVSWCKDVVVLDSGSRDKTVALARKKKARVVTRPFDNWASHQNWALKNIKFKNPWVFYLDADERMTPELKEEILAIAADIPRPEKAFFCGRRNFFLGKWIRHAYPPSHILRFFKPPFVRFERLVNPAPVIRGPYGYLRNRFDHYNFSKGIAEWVEKHNRYSTLEALEGIKDSGSGIPLGGLFSSDPYLRRKSLKALSFWMPFRPLLKFFYMYVLKLGFLDGGPGLTYCVLQAYYEYLIVLKMKEIRLKGRGVRT